MPDKGYTVSPVITTNERGEEVISDLSVSSGHAAAIGRDGQVRDAEFDYYEDEKGQMRHRFSNIELESERDDSSSFDEDAYIGAIFEANPEISDAQLWAENNLPEPLLDEYNKAIDSGSLDELHQAVEWLLAQYAERTEDTPEPEQVEEDSEMEDLSDEEKKVLANAVETLELSEPQGEYTAEQWQEVVEQAEAQGNETYAKVAAATAAFHSGEVTAEEAINFCLNECDLKELAKVYEYINGQT